ncbi:MAG: citramalate synthase [Magnetococcales bacterium]|nr:citramalate synthase [Magnetococcales bacterium]
MTKSATHVAIYDTTLRDGAQSEDVLFSVEDKLRIVERLDALGVDFVEGGWPGANPKDGAFFQQVKKLPLGHCRISAFGSTARPGNPMAEDPVLEALVRAETGVVTLFGKSWTLHVTKALGISLAQNLELIYESVRYLKRHVDTVIYDAEHFFDGFKADGDYALQTLKAAHEGGAACLVLCDTNGGTLVSEIGRITARAAAVGGPLGIHCHNDSGLAVANSLMAVEAGVVQVQGTINGLGERCGNADLTSVIPNLCLKMPGVVTSLDGDRLKELMATSRFVNEMANRSSQKNQPFVGASAFAHKGGIHVSAVLKDSATYEHIQPGLVGNRQRVLVSEQSGRSNLFYKLQAFGITDLTQTDPRIQALLEQVKEAEHRGYQFDGADASFELMARKALGQLPDYFSLRGFRVIDQRRVEEDGRRVVFSDASVKVAVGQLQEHTAAEGNGPLNALDQALRKALARFYPNLWEVELDDFKVRIISGGGTAAQVRVLIESQDARDRWGTVGMSDNIVVAAYEALVDSLVYKLFKDGSVPPAAPPDNG